MSTKQAWLVATFLLIVVFVPLDYVVATLIFFLLFLPAVAYLLRVILALFK